MEAVVDFLQPARGGLFIDCTLGMGGHTEALLAASPETTVIGIDRDKESLELALSRLTGYGDRFKPMHANFKELRQVLDSLGSPPARGIVADLGISSYQLESPQRGFSFKDETAPLDMRMDRNSTPTAAELVNTVAEGELADLIFEYGEERGSRKIARLITRERAKHRIETTGELASIIVKALRTPGRWRIHPATRTFQALRIAVNQEIMGLAEFVHDAITCLEPSGRLAIISFHSLEDRTIKTAFRLENGKCQCDPKLSGAPGQWRVEQATRTEGHRSDGGSDIVCEVCGARKRIEILTRKPVTPSASELALNPRARSARLRVCKRLEPLAA